MNNSEQAQLDWTVAIQENIKFFREQSKLLNDAFNPSQVASGALMTILIMNHNMIMTQLKLLETRLDIIEKVLLHDAQPPSH